MTTHPATIFEPELLAESPPSIRHQHFRLDTNSNVSKQDDVAADDDFFELERNAIYRLLLPLFAVLRLYGLELDPLADERGRQRGTPSRYCGALYRVVITVIIMLFHVFCLLIDFGYIAKVNKTKTRLINMDATSERMCSMLMYCAAAATHLMLVARQGRIRLLFEQLVRVSVDRKCVAPESSGKGDVVAAAGLKKMMAAVVLVPYLSCACLMLVDVGRAAMGEEVIRFKVVHFWDFPDPEFYLTYYRKNMENFIDEYLTLRQSNLYVQQTVWCMVTYPLYLLGAAIFVLICVMLRQNFRKLLQKTGTGGATRWTPNETDLRSLIKRHRILCELVSRVDETFSIFNFCWCAIEVFGLTFAVRAMNLTSGQGWRPELLQYVAVLLGAFAAKSLLASSLNAQVIESLPLIRNGFDFVDAVDSSKSAKMTRNRLNLYLQTVVLDTEAVSGAGYYIFGKGFSLAVGGTILTYVVVLYGFQ